MRQHPEPDKSRRVLYRIAGRHHGRGLTRQQLADTLGISRQALAHHEVGRLRVAVSMLGPIATEPDASVMELLEEPAAKGAARRGPTPTLRRPLEQVARLPRARQRTINELSVIAGEDHPSRLTLPPRHRRGRGAATSA